MDAFIFLLTTAVISYVLFRWLGSLADRDRQKRLDRLQKWIDEGHLSDAIDRQYGYGKYRKR
jgi:hypothetical protein